MSHKEGARRPQDGKAHRICFYLAPRLVMLNTDVRFSHCCFLRGLYSSQIYKVCLRHQLCCLVPESWEKSCLSTPGDYQHEFQCKGRTLERSGEKGGEGRREILCGLRRWQVQKFMCLCIRIHMHVSMCVGGCVGAEESRLKEGKRYWVGKQREGCWELWEGQYSGWWLKYT